MGLTVQHTSLRRMGGAERFGPSLVLLSQLHARAHVVWDSSGESHTIGDAPQGHGGVSDPQLTYLWDVGGLFLKPHAIARPSFASLADGAAGALHPRL